MPQNGAVAPAEPWPFSPVSDQDSFRSYEAQKHYPSPETIIDIYQQTDSQIRNNYRSAEGAHKVDLSGQYDEVETGPQPTGVVPMGVERAYVLSGDISRISGYIDFIDTMNNTNKADPTRRAQYAQAQLNMNRWMADIKAYRPRNQ